MKKFLLILGSWAMMLMGTATFTSCGDDDDDDNNGGNGGSSSVITLVENNKNLTEATVVGDDVICPFDYVPGLQCVCVYHYEGNKLQNVSMIMDCQTEETAKQAMSQYSSYIGEDAVATTEGKYLIIKGSAEDLDMEDAEGMSKEDLVKYLNEEMESEVEWEIEG